MLSGIKDLEPWFQNKLIDCIRVDGATDEGPSHEEVQFYWTEWNLINEKVATYVTTRHSGGSYLNKVEMQNGCLALAHSNLFIPSTLTGSNTTARGIDNDRLATNLDAAIDVYISRVDNAPCGGSQISLFKGAKDEHAKMLQDRRQSVLTFLKGSAEMKKELEAKDPELFSYFKKIWDMRSRHMVKNLPKKYVFALLPCYKTDCIHPVCSNGKYKDMAWYKDGPLLSLIPFPIRDPDFPWGNKKCSKCKPFCAGHFLPPEKCVEHIMKNGMGKCILKPPTEVIEEAFTKSLPSKKNKSPQPLELINLAKATLLTETDVAYWVQHLKDVKERRKEGAIKAKATRERSKGNL